MDEADKSEILTIAPEIKGEEKSVSTLYRMELAKGFFNTKQENQTSSALFSDYSRQSAVGKTNEDDQTFGSWKSKNRVFNHSQISEGTNMISNLGRSLDHCEYIVPNTPRCGTDFIKSEAVSFKMPPVATDGIVDTERSREIDSRTFPDKSCRQRRCSLETHMDCPHYFPHEKNLHIPPKFCGSVNHQSKSFGKFCRTSPVVNQKLDNSKKKLQYFSHHVKENHPKEMLQPVLSSPCCRSAKCSSHIDPYLSLKEEKYCHGEDHCYANQYYNFSHKENDNACNCCSPIITSKHKKKHKDESLQNNHISDLYRILYLQNQQLGLLQKQVQKLIELNLKDEKLHTNVQENAVLNKKYVKGTTEKRTFNLSVIKENENLEKVSVGIMTSFVENNYAKMCTNTELKGPCSYKSHSSSDSEEGLCQNSSDGDENSPRQKTIQYRADEANNISFTLNDVPAVVEDVPSPQTSFHIEMQEYKSSSDTESSSDSSSSDSDENSPTPVGWTFYDTVVGKVNGMLKLSLDKKNNDFEEDDVRNATLDQLRQLGVSFAEPESPLTKRVTFNNRNNRTKLTNRQQLNCDSETSLHMNALANKYLKNGEILSRPNKGTDWQNHRLTCQNNLSHATLQYLEKYHLSPNDRKKETGQLEDKIKKKKNKKKGTQKGLEKTQSHAIKHGKILDITAIKKQPKLLPKAHE